MSEKISVPHISFEMVSKSFAGGGEIISRINLTIDKGEFVVLLGPSGSGKSTLLRLIAGLETETSGVIIRRQANSFDKAFVFQDAHLMPWRTLKENIELPLELMAVPADERSRRSLAALSLVGLETFDDFFPAELSGGMKMRASLARALVVQPELLLLDEPFAALDELTRFRLAEELRQLWLKYKMTIIFVTHSLQEACFLGERILALSSKPAQITAEIKIELPENRKNSVRTEPIFNEQIKKIYKALNLEHF